MAPLRQAREPQAASFQIHPEIGPGGSPAPLRVSPRYEALAAEAKSAGLPLNWSPRIAYSPPALALSELVRGRRRERHEAFVATVFDACFGRRLNIEEPEVLLGCLSEIGIDAAELVAPASLTVGEDAVGESEAAGRAAGVTGTPAWRIDGRLLVGLQPAETFRSLAARALP